jgi:hypothetical protein
VEFFTKHPRENGMTYISHFFYAMSLSFLMILGAFCLFVHAFLPSFFDSDGTTIIKKLYSKIIERKK